MLRQYSILFVAILSVLGSQLDAAEPVFTIGKPPLADIAYTPDGRFLATLSKSYSGTATVELLDAESFVSVHRIDAIEGNRHIQFSPDGNPKLAIFGNKGSEAVVVSISTRFTQATLQQPVKCLFGNESVASNHLRDKRNFQHFLLFLLVTLNS